MRNLLLLMLLLVSVSVWAESFFIDGIRYETSDETTLSVISDAGYEGDIVIPSSVTYEGKTYSVTSIGDYAIYGCNGLMSISIPESVTSIGDGAFYGCSGLTSVVIPSSVTSIGKEAFVGCSSLTSVSIPSSVTSIGRDAFRNCIGLETIIVEDGNIKYDSRDNCNAIIESATKTLVAGCKNTIIPNSVTSIGNGAFSGCSGLTSVIIPSSVLIGVYAFAGCSGLTSVTIQNGVTSIGFRAFEGCSGLTSVTIPSSVTSIDANAFIYCINLETIIVEDGNTKYDSRDNCNAIIESATKTLIQGCKNTIIPSSVTSIGNGAFEGCSGLTSIEIPSSVTSIGNNAFNGCSGLTSIEIPSSVTSIGIGAFVHCFNLRIVRFEYETPIDIGFHIGYHPFNNCHIEALYIPEGTMDAYIEQWGKTYIDMYFFKTMNFNYIELNKLPKIENTIGGDAIVVAVDENDVTLSIKFDEGFTLGKIIVNGIVVYPSANKAQKEVSVTDLGDGKYLVSGVTNEDIIKVVYSDGNENPTAIEDVTTSRPSREGIYDLMGRKLSAPQRGINIINGKKVIVK